MNMKLFKRIYYPALALFALLFFIFSAVNATTGSYDRSRFDDEFMGNVRDHVRILTQDERNVFNLTHLDYSRDYIFNQLTEFSEVVETIEVRGDIEPREFHTAINSGDPDHGERWNTIWRNTPVTTRQRAIVNQSTGERISCFEPNELHIMRHVENVITFIPGRATREGRDANAVMFMAHFDSVHQGAMDNAVPVSAMLEVARHLMENYHDAFENDLIFVFTDAEEEGMLGAYAFWYQFRAFDNVTGRVSLGTNFDSMGNGGNILMFETHHSDHAMMREYSRIRTSVFTSSLAAMVYSAMPNFTDFDIYGPYVPSLNFANVGGFRVYHTQQDTYENANFRLAGQFADIMFDLADHFGNFNFGTYNNQVLQDSARGVFFTYLRTTASFPFSVSYVLGGLIILLFIVLVVLNMKKKHISWSGVAKGGFVQVLTLLATTAMMFLMYFIITMLLVLFGALPFRGIMSILYLNLPIVIFSLILAGTIAVTFYIIFKKAFAAKGKDVVRGNSVIIVMLGLILSFALPAAGYLFSIIAILLLGVMIASVLFGEKIREKFKMDSERLFLHTVPMIFGLPIILPVVILGGQVLGAILFPVFILLFLLLMGSILPYANYLKPSLNTVWGRFPQKTIRYERTVTEQVEDKAKKGKFKEVTEKKIVKEKEKRTYRNRTGLLIMTVTAIVALLFSGGFGARFNDNLIGGMGWNSMIYHSAVVLVVDGSNRTLEVHDIVSMRYFERAYGFGGFSWDGELRAFTKTAPSGLDIPNHNPVSRNGYDFSFSLFYARSGYVTVTVDGVRDVTAFIFTPNALVGELTEDIEHFRVENRFRRDSFTFKMPVPGPGSITDGGTFFMRIEGSAPSIEVSYTEKVFNHNIVENINEFVALQNHFNYQDYPDIHPHLRANLIFRHNATLTA